MSVRVVGETIFVEGIAQVADAEPILSALLEAPGRTVDIGGATGLHSATLQLFLALRPRIVGTPGDSFASRWVLPLVDTGEGQE